MLSGRGLCDELITRPEESYRLCCVVVCDLETSRMGVPYIYYISRLRVKPNLVWAQHSCLLIRSSSLVLFLNSNLFNDSPVLRIAFFSMAHRALIGQGLRIFEASLSHTHAHTHTHTHLGKTPLDERSARRRDLSLTTDNNHNRQTSMPPAGFEPAIPASGRSQTHTLDGAATGIGTSHV